MVHTVVPVAEVVAIDLEVLDSPRKAREERRDTRFWRRDEVGAGGIVVPRLAADAEVDDGREMRENGAEV
jgi:hypothetical protein